MRGSPFLMVFLMFLRSLSQLLTGSYLPLSPCFVECLCLSCCIEYVSHTVRPLWELHLGVATIPAYKETNLWVPQPIGGLSDGHSYWHRMTIKKGYGIGPRYTDAKGLTTPLPSERYRVPLPTTHARRCAIYPTQIRV